MNYEALLPPLVQSQCKHCFQPGVTFICGGCRVTFYCNVKCQQNDWTKHQKKCKSALNTKNNTTQIDIYRHVLCFWSHSLNSRHIADELIYLILAYCDRKLQTLLIHCTTQSFTINQKQYKYDVVTDDIWSKNQKLTHGKQAYIAIKDFKQQLSKLIHIECDLFVICQIKHNKKRLKYLRLFVDNQYLRIKASNGITICVFEIASRDYVCKQLRVHDKVECKPMIVLNLFKDGNRMHHSLLSVINITKKMENISKTHIKEYIGSCINQCINKNANIECEYKVRFVAPLRKYQGCHKMNLRTERNCFCLIEWQDDIILQRIVGDVCRTIMLNICFNK
eukprot:540246_1